METKILIGDKDNVDFSSTIKMNPEEKNKFLELLNSLFAVVQEESGSRAWRMGSGGRIQYPRTWEAEEYEFLLKAKTIEEASQKLARSGMSIIIQAGKWEYEYYNWYTKKRKDMNQMNDLKNIKEFMKECEENKINRLSIKKQIKQDQEALKILLERKKRCDEGLEDCEQEDYEGMIREIERIESTQKDGKF